MPADSCPRCCNAYSPKYVSFATSSPGAQTPKTPQASCGPFSPGMRSWFKRPSPRDTSPSLPHPPRSARGRLAAERQLGEHLVARPPPASLTQVRLHEREVLDPPGRPLPGVERADPPGRLRRPVEAAERDVRGEARAVGRRSHRARGIAYAARHRHEVTADLLDAGPQHARGIRVREGAGSGEAQDERVAACRGPGERLGQVVEASLGNGPEEGEGDVPLVPVGPADLGAGLAPRLEVGLEVVEDVVGWDDGDEEPHGSIAAPVAMRASTSSMPHAPRADRVSAPGVDGGAPSAAGVREKRGAGAGWTTPWCST